MTFIKSKSFGLGLVAFVYISAIIMSYWLYLLIDFTTPVWELLIIDLSATLYVYLWSCIWRNASLYDPYWSVAPLLLGLFWLDQSYSSISQIPIKIWFIYGIIVLWGIRLTWNWMRWFTGLDYEDWRYRAFREKTGKWFFLVNLFAIQVFPTVIVFLGSLSMSYSLSTINSSNITIFDIVGFIVAFGAILIESMADRQLHVFVKGRTDRNQIMNKGLWGRSRHPNYLGEVSFWWGLYFFSLGADISSWWVLIGPIAITVLFLTYSIPAMDKYQLSKKEQYKIYMSHTPAFIPRIFRRNK